MWSRPEHYTFPSKGGLRKWSGVMDEYVVDLSVTVRAESPEEAEGIADVIRMEAEVVRVWSAPARRVRPVGQDITNERRYPG